jgi:hypothetical protein
LIIQNTERLDQSPAELKIIMNGFTQTIDGIFWLSKERIANDKWPSLRQLLIKEGAIALDKLNAKNATYSSAKIVEQVQHELSNMFLENGLKELITVSPVISLLTDESSTITPKKELIIYVRGVQNGRALTRFGALIEIPDGKADTIMKVLVDFMNTTGIKHRQMIGFGSDGASVMTGTENGVATQLKRLCPFVFSVHDIAHRVALASHDAATTVGFMEKKFKVALSTFFWYVHTSANRTYRLSVEQVCIVFHSLLMHDAGQSRSASAGCGGFSKGALVVIVQGGSATLSYLSCVSYFLCFLAS